MLGYLVKLLNIILGVEENEMLGLYLKNVIKNIEQKCFNVWSRLIHLFFKWLLGHVWCSATL